MSVDTVNGHVLFPHRANWADRPKLSRRWENEVSDSEFGNESRYALRSVPRKVLEWTVTARDLQEQSQLVDRIVAAMNSGLACAPQWGRASELAEDVAAGDSTIEVEPTLWPWAADDYMILLDGDEFEVAQILSVAGEILTLTAGVAGAHVGPFVWPLFFGQFDVDNYGLISERQGSATLSIAELTSPEAVTIGTSTPEIDGIGGWIISDTFEVQ